MHVVEEVLSFILRHGLVPGGSRVLVALSGGSDSVAMTHILMELARSGKLEAEFAAAHLNHCLRGKEADEDQKFVVELARSLDLPLVSRRYDVPELAKRESLSIETAARKARLNFLIDAARELNCPLIATGHTADDQAETVLFRIARGTGLRGLAGIPVKRRFGTEADAPLFVRPVLSAARSELTAYLQARGLSWRTDSTNKDVEYHRNRIRHHLLPMLREELNPGVDGSLTRLASLAAAADDFVVSAAEHALEETLVSSKADQIVISVKKILALHPAVQSELIRLVHQRLSTPADASGITEGFAQLPFVREQEVERLLEGRTGARAELPGGVVAVREYENLVFSRTESSASSETSGGSEWSTWAPVPGAVVLLDGGTIETIIKDVEDGDSFLVHFLPGKEHGVEALDASCLGDGGRLSVRNRREGDVFFPLGAPGKRKLQDVLVDLKVPRAERENVPLVLASDGEILWVAPFRISEKAKVTGTTRRILLLHFHK